MAITSTNKKLHLGQDRAGWPTKLADWAGTTSLRVRFPANEKKSRNFYTRKKIIKKKKREEEEICRKKEREKQKNIGSCALFINYI